MNPFGRVLAAGAATGLLFVPPGSSDTAARAPEPQQQAKPQQQPPVEQQPTFRSTTALVEVDVIVLDRDGNFVPGLKRDDFTIFEDGKPQQIQQFYMVTYNTPSGIPAQHADVADHKAPRVFVIVFDEAHLDNESLLRVKFGAEKFIHEQMSPGDMGGVFVGGGMFHGRLSNDKGELLAGVRSARPVVDNRQALLAPFREFPRIPSEVDAMRIADGSRELTARLGEDACREDPVECVRTGGQGGVENAIQNKARLYVRQARMLTSNTLFNLQRVARGLARMPGRKTVVYLTEGFYVEESRSQLQMIAAEAARGGTTIYSIDGRGFISTGTTSDAVSRERGRSLTFDTGDDGPNILTSGTGGFMVRRIDDMSRAFGLIVRDTSTYYVVGYQPENTTMDGKFRKIEVKTKQGLKVRARKGYAALALPPQDSPFTTTIK
jgi:VWFA-related protein